MTDDPTDTSSRPHSARIWNYWLGGTDNTAADRTAGDAWLALNPEVVDVVRESRAFLGRAVEHLAGAAGVRQFLDIGAGLPAVENTHQIVARIAPDATVVCVDHEPEVVAHAERLLAGAATGPTHFVDADIGDPAGMLRLVGEHIDLRRPVAVLLMGVLGHIPDLDEARDLVRYVMDRTCPGSYLVAADGTHVVVGEAVRKAGVQYADTGAVPYTTREPHEIESFFEGLEFLPPGCVSVSRWRPHPDAGEPALVDGFGGVGRKR
ncbi:SAM-dependent methyltransferase [Pseudonocardia humida]|uniref:SAM-dependent methyltransferase n=1 Tax=Pseudonocardia humida TaxID=2800819 RepID=A0ABT1A500_9PSEU|nr:SAM-dependent methyltransferase [Pseudonocardia humida]MCO1658055.1 SAM-dependent methyltransferase [Pseudonocardia humida]